MARILIIAEHDGSTLDASIAKCVSCAAQITNEGIDVAVFSSGGAELCAQAARIEGVSRVLQVDHEVYAHPLAATVAPQVVAMAEPYSHILGSSTTFGRDVMPRVAALLGVAQVSDIMHVEGAYRFRRPIYAGNAIVTVEAAPERKLVGTVRIASYRAAGESNSAAIESVAVSAGLPSHTRFVELRASGGDRPDLQTAARVVAGGRAFGSKEKFDLLYSLADKLGAGVGASRAAVDAGYCANDMQVGQTGKIIAPELYMAFGISGAIQHLTGIKDAGTIVAINKDPDAPIFEVADIGLVGDLFEIIPALEQALGD
jgi:electron transfer flavoprotein alpha subunit